MGWPGPSMILVTERRGECLAVEPPARRAKTVCPGVIKCFVWVATFSGGHDHGRDRPNRAQSANGGRLRPTICVRVYSNIRGLREVRGGQLGLFAFPAVIVGGAMKLMVSLDKAALAGGFVGTESGSAQENQRRGKYSDGDDPSNPKEIGGKILHEFSPETLLAVSKSRLRETGTRVVRMVERGRRYCAVSDKSGREALPTFQRAQTEAAPKVLPTTE